MKKTFQALFIISILTYIGIRIYLHHPLPKYTGNIKMEQLSKQVDVFTDKFGVPHIFAENENDLFFTAGYIAARDRLFQMTMVAHAVRGELASALGDEYIDSDIYLRTWRINAVSKKVEQKLDKETLNILSTFCDGINQRINELGKNLPIEFKIIGLKPLLWRPSDVIGYARLMAHELQSSWKTEIVFGAIAENFGMEKFLEIYPDDNDFTPTIASQLQNKSLSPFYTTILNNENKVRDLLGFSTPFYGSNNWVVHGSKTESGKPLLANDPHLGFMQPPRWYEMHLKGGDFNVSGICIAGIPVPIIGQNENCAWGFTNVMIDDVDFFVETTDENRPNQYLSGNQWLDMEIIEEIIPLKNGRDTTIVIRKTHHGPIVSDIHPLLKNGNTTVSMAWTGHWETNEMGTFLGLNKMKNWNDFTETVKSFGVPGQNMVYADVEGNIGWRPAVYIPIRKKGSSLLPRPGQDKSYDWKGKVPFEEMPYLYNPEKGFISTANNKTIGDEFPYYISGLWADPSRASRIEEMLKESDQLNVTDMKKIQLDLNSNFAKEITPYFLDAKTGKETGNLKKAYDYLENWDGVELAESAPALIFNAANIHLIKNLYGDELDLLGEGYLEAYIGLKYIHSRKLRSVLSSGNSSWFDDVETKDYIETKDDILRKSMKDAVLEIEASLGQNVSNWKWGRAHTLTHEHVLGKIKILDWLFGFNVGPFPQGGSDKTPRAGGYSTSDPYKETAGASMRRIVDFDDLNQTQFILPTGQSGLYNSPHYDDQAEMFQAGEYRTTWFDEDYIRKADHFRKLTLLPGK
ncbi:MAG: penicillin acylase family protein [Candidatus Marinimicrobia bacterium]|jgi:penicillin amidase|nr:penicillin acylase family protein [Candidatus Neomarinimicrobiota bacterium]MBT4145169.1 penicillin acylase family protein [Candidatus Neomarinimicrobiota bacterium]MBT4176970.1 penicillin acylase family protein [Candidatus Neomarinimicrobiota bacterium]MBT4593696.1 penicillin acylase family protein [Candidatus Neomarinimicrobiota bacterium]MBT4990599.1 penicillin acylase family protein [Candidatus Neomarinimicrobiota bacterium]